MIAARHAAEETERKLRFFCAEECAHLTRRASKALSKRIARRPISSHSGHRNRNGGNVEWSPARVADGPSGDVPYKMTLGRGAKHYLIRVRITGNTDDKPA